MSTGDTPAESIRIVVQVPQPHREPPGSLFCPDNPSFLFFAWLHWMLVHAAGLGSYLFVVTMLGTWADRVRIFRGFEGLEVAFGVMLTLGCPLFVASLEGLVLRRVGLPAYGWEFCQCLALAFGLMLSVPVFCAAFSDLASLFPLLIGLLGLFAIGAGMGFVQLYWLELDAKGVVSWWISTGLGVIAAAIALVPALYVFRTATLRGFGSDVLLATFAGGTYGAVSGWGVVQALRRLRRLRALAGPIANTQQTLDH
jgi:hypothetical protein